MRRNLPRWKHAMRSREEEENEKEEEEDTVKEEEVKEEEEKSLKTTRRRRRPSGNGTDYTEGGRGKREEERYKALFALSLFLREFLVFFFVVDASR